MHRDDLAIDRERRRFALRVDPIRAVWVENEPAPFVLDDDRSVLEELDAVQGEVSFARPFPRAVGRVWGSAPLRHVPPTTLMMAASSLMIAAAGFAPSPVARVPAVARRALGVRMEQPLEQWLEQSAGVNPKFLPKVHATRCCHRAPAVHLRPTPPRAPRRAGD